MGIYISLNVSKRVTAEEWQSVYEKSLIIAKKTELFQMGYRIIHGERIGCIYPTEEETDINEKRDDTGWCAVGSFPGYGRAETQFMPKYIVTDPDGAADALEALIPMLKSDYKPATRFLWGNKTQGEDYHMFMLAIGCMAEHELGAKAVVYGDITYGQCIKAAKIVSEILGYEIRPSVRCRAEDMCERVLKMNQLTDIEKIEFFIEFYLGRKDELLGECIKQKFPERTISDYWNSRLKGKVIGNYGFSDIMKEYFQLGFSLKAFCEMADFDKENQELCREFIEMILDTSMHIENKDCSDIMDYTDSEQPYGIGSLFASIFFRGAKNPAINRYIPIEEITDVLSECFGNVLDVKSVIEEYLKKDSPSEKERLHNKFTETIRETATDEAEKYDEYDICNYKDLIDFNENSRLHPELKSVLEKSFIFYTSVAEEPECLEMMQKSADEMFTYLARESRIYYLSENHWNKIYDDLHRDKESFKRFYPFLRVKASGNLEYLTRAFVGDDLFWNYCCSHFLNCNN